MGKNKGMINTTTSEHPPEYYMGGEDSDSPPRQAPKRKKTAKGKEKQVAKGKEKQVAKGKEKQVAKEKETKKGKRGERKALTPAERASMMRKMVFVPTKWADFSFLDELEIREDVVDIFRKMGLEGILNMAQPSYEEETIQFISTLRFEDHPKKKMSDQNRGILHFKIHGKSHSLPVAQLAAIYNLPSGGKLSKVLLDWDECQAVWKDIAHGVFKKGTSKSSAIRNPALRYAHIFLAHTLFGRKEKGNVREEEFGLLIEGIKERLVHTSDELEIVGQEESINYGHFLAKRFLEFQVGIDGCKDAKPQIHFGGLITPILTTLKVRISSEEEPTINRIGAKELVTNKSLVGKVGSKYAYRFRNGSTKGIMLLPNHTSTRLSSRSNILFDPQPDHVYNLAFHGPIEAIHAPSGLGYQPYQQEHEDEDPISGSSRYKYEPYEGIVTSEALRNAHKNISSLNRFVHWQNKNMKKAFRIIKKQGDEIKRLKTMCFSLINSANREGTSHHQHLATTSHEEEGSNDSNDPISPASSGSGNPSYSLGYASEEF